jgi:hypothetical protein
MKTAFLRATTSRCTAVGLTHQTSRVHGHMIAQPCTRVASIWMLAGRYNLQNVFGVRQRRPDRLLGRIADEPGSSVRA